MLHNNILVSVAKMTAQVLENLSMQQVGIELSHFSYPWILDKPDLQADIQHHKMLLQGFSLPKSMHGAFYDLNPVARDSKVVGVCDFRVRQSLDIAAELAMNKIVFHTNFIPSTKRDYLNFWIEKQVLFWEKYIPFLQASHTILLLENTQEENAGFILPIVQAIDSPYIKICYDTGHSHCFTDAKVKPAKWVAAYQEELAYIHLHGNHGKTDEHIAFTAGNVDFSGFFEGVTALQNAPDIIIEVKTPADYLTSLAALRQIGFLSQEKNQ